MSDDDRNPRPEGIPESSTEYYQQILAQKDQQIAALKEQLEDWDKEQSQGFYSWKETFDATCDSKNKEIAALKQDVNKLNNLLRSVGWGQGEIDSSATIAEESEAKDRRIAQLEAEAVSDLVFVRQAEEIKVKDERIAQMAALLDKIEHRYRPICFSDTNCPACAWEKIRKEGVAK